MIRQTHPGQKDQAKASSRRSRGRRIHRNESGPCAKRGHSAKQSCEKQILIQTPKETTSSTAQGGAGSFKR